MPAKKKKAQIAAYTYPGDTRPNIPTAEVEPVMDADKKKPITLEYERASRNADLDPQLVWRGKDKQDQEDLAVTAPPIFIQEKVHPRVLIEDLMRQSSKERKREEQLDLFADFNGLDDPDLKGDYYEHEQNWSNRMILGDSLQAMASLAGREGYQGKVQCIYMDPPYGIRFNSNFQWSTTSRDVRDGNRQHITREPEQVKAFRDTWRDGVHSYLTYLRDRLTVARDLLSDSGSIFVQIGDENVHRVRTVMDEVFGEDNFVRLITFVKTTGQTDNLLASVSDYMLWFAKDRAKIKFRRPLKLKNLTGQGGTAYNNARSTGGGTRSLTDREKAGKPLLEEERIYRIDNLTSQSPGTRYDVQFHGHSFFPKGYWKTQESSMGRLLRADRIQQASINLYYIRYFDDYLAYPITDNWDDTSIAGFSADKRYVVETSTKVVERCILMATDPGDLVLDPTCGSGTTAYVAEQWGRRWITIDTSRVALALARTRIMGARYPHHLLADSPEGQFKEAEISRHPRSETTTFGNIRQGFVYERVPHITLRDIANNAEIDVIWEEYQEKLEPLREELNRARETSWEEWEIPREARDPWPESAAEAWSVIKDSQVTEANWLVALRIINQELGRNYALNDVPEHPSDPWEPEAAELHRQWWEQRIARQKDIDASIGARAEYEYLYDKPYEDRTKIRVAGPFTVESLSPHRLLVSSEAEGPDSTPAETPSSNGHHYEGTAPERDFAQMIIENLRTSGVQQTTKEGKIEFNSIEGWPGEYICAEAEYTEGDSEKRAGVFIGPEFGTVGQPDLTAAAREAGQAGFDVLISCAFSYDAHATEFTRLGALPILKARMNADLHMDANLKNTGNGNLFVIFGEPDITVEEPKEGQLQVRISGVDIYDPSTGQVRSDDTDGIACWFIDTDYNEESFFVRHAYFLGANDPYKALKTTLKTEIDKESWGSLNSEISRPFPKPESGRIAVKVINHLGDEAMKVIRV